MIFLKTDLDGRIISSEINNEIIMPLDVDTYVVESLPDGDINDYLFIDNQFIYSPRAETLRLEKQREIITLKAQLNATDYAIIKIVEGAATQEEYQDVILKRAEWRTRINELETELSE